MIQALSALISTQTNKPLSIVVAVFALFAPAFLTIFLARPDLFFSMGVNGVLLLSICISLPIVMLCYGIWWTPLSTILRILRALQGQVPETDFLRLVTTADPLEWPCLLAGAWSASVVIFIVAVVAYFVPIRVGATFLLVASILFGVWFLVLIATIVLESWVRRKFRARLEELLKALTTPPPSGQGSSGAA